MATFGQPDPGVDAQDPTADIPAPKGLGWVRDRIDSQRRASIRTVKLRDGQRPEWRLVCQVPSNLDEVMTLESKAEEAAQDSGAPNEAVIAACMKIARYTRAVRLDGRDILDGEDAGGGSPFAYRPLQEALGVAGMQGSAWRAVRELFMGEGEYDDMIIVRLVGQLSEESGLMKNSAFTESDPT